MKDSQLIFSDDQTLAFAVGTAISTNVIDLGVANRGKGSMLEIEMVLSAAFTAAGGAATLQVAIWQGTTAAATEFILFFLIRYVLN